VLYVVPLRRDPLDSEVRRGVLPVEHVLDVGQHYGVAAERRWLPSTQRSPWRLTGSSGAIGIAARHYPNGVLLTIDPLSGATPMTAQGHNQPIEASPWQVYSSAYSGRTASG
jgi:hypothetical protein